MSRRMIILSAKQLAFLPIPIGTKQYIRMYKVKQLGTYTT